MYIRTLRLANFRNYTSLDFHPSRELNILVGANAQGKSAILEAIYVLATSKSHRTSRDMDLIRLGEDIARVTADVERSQRNEVTLEVILSKAEKKTVKINTVKHPKIGDIVGQLNAVIFSSTDIDMVKGEPSRRRRFLNLEISQISPQYVYSLGRYKRILDQRNNLLREIKYGSASIYGLDVWDSQLAAYGSVVVKRRGEFLSFLADAAARIHSSLTKDSEEMGISYKCSVETDYRADEKQIEVDFAAALASRRERDLAQATTTVGPHRDDIIISIDSLPAREFASQGQQRSAAIALKLAEIELMESYMGESPVVLLDDVMAELDETRRSQILELTCGRCQTLITTTQLADLEEETIRSASVFEVISGRVVAR